MLLIAPIQPLQAAAAPALGQLRQLPPAHGSAKPVTQQEYLGRNCQKKEALDIS